MNKIKKTGAFALTAFLIVVGIVIYSCTSDCDGPANSTADATPTVEFTPEEQALIDQFSVAGVKHNEGVADIYNSISTIKKKGMSASNIRKKVLEQIQYSVENYISRDESFDKQTKSLVSNTFNANRLLLLLPSQSITHTLDSTASSIKTSNKYRKLQTELLSLSEKFNTPVNQFTYQIDVLNKRALSELDQQELLVFLIGSSIAMSSYEYWHKHINDWHVILKGSSMPSFSTLKRGQTESDGSMPDWLNETLKADIAAGIGAAIISSKAAVVAFAAGPASALAYLASIGGAAAAASAGALVAALIV